MALIDYGTIVFKNGKLINNCDFEEMSKMVGWEDTEYDVDSCTGTPLNIKDKYYAYIGDKDNTICFYKTSIKIINRYDPMYFSDKTEYNTEMVFFDCTGFKWSSWENYIGMDICRVTKRNGYFVLKWDYKGDKYKVYFGYGVDINYYKKYHIVNYYLIPRFLRRFFPLNTR